ncbi:MAG: diguanylate cyclase domain-containing protein [Leptospirillum sp.]
MVRGTRFESVNDSCGHKAGDRVLPEIASRLRTCLRETDFLARPGETNSPFRWRPSVRSDLENTLERIGKTVRQPVRMDVEKSVMVDLSAGVCLFPLPLSEVRTPDIIPAFFCGFPTMPFANARPGREAVRVSERFSENPSSLFQPPDSSESIPEDHCQGG